MFVASPVSAIAVLLFSGVSAYLVAQRLRLHGGRAVRALAMLVLWQAIEIIPIQVIAALQLLHGISIVSIPKAAVAEFAVLVLSFLWSLRTPRPERLSETAANRGMVPGYILLSSGILACSYLAYAINAFTSFPQGADALIYHLPLATRWLQEGSLAIPANHVWRFSMPGNAEIGMMVLLSSGWQAAVAFSNWMSLAVVTISTYLLGMWLGGKRRAIAILCMLLVLGLPLLEAQAFSAYVDLLATSGILAAFALLLTSWRNAEPVPHAIWFLSALACGISIGTKPVYYLYAALFCAFAAVVLWFTRYARKTQVLKAAGLVLFGLLLPSFFWFARAAVETGNLLYPMQVKVAGHLLLPGYARSEITEPGYELNSVHDKVEWFIYPWTEWKKLTGYLKVPYGEGDGLGAAFAAFVPLGMLYFLLQLFRNRSATRRNVALLVAFLLMFAAWWSVMERVLRFGQVIAIFTCILSVPVLSVFEARNRRAFAALFIVSISATALITASIPLHLLAGRTRKHLWSREAVYNYPKLIDELPAGSVVLNATSQKDKNFVLAGRLLSNRVIASFEIPSTPQGLPGTGAQYLAEIAPDSLYSDVELSRSGATLIDDEMVPTGENNVRWKIWKLK
ncbi:MAG TPA: hypothetical protein VFM77_21105 [Terriglobales bacterium]|nr:hypothetical protein [Terriglobales bacterium]